MAEITAQDVKALRDATGAGMMDAKKALVEAEGDRDKAAQILRQKGLSKVATLEDRENNQGTVAMLLDLAALAHPIRTPLWVSRPTAAIYALDELVCWPLGRRNAFPAKNRSCWVVWRPHHAAALPSGGSIRGNSAYRPIPTSQRR